MDRPEPRILVVDDETDTCDNLRDILTDFGYDVDTAANGDRALDLVARELYDIALLDLKMPGINGVELYRQIRSHQSTLVGLILTAYASPETTVEAMQAGALRVLAKPVDPPALLELIAHVVAQGRPPGARGSDAGQLN